MSIQRVVVVGGTHGNEWTGAYLARHWQAAPLSCPGVDVEVVLANPAAFAATRRYIDRDLNRCFTRASLDDVDDGTYEPTRARELREVALSGHAPDKVFVLDLHTTTANMGPSLVLGDLSPVSAELAAYLMDGHPDVRAYRWAEETASGARADPGFFAGLTPHGLAIEVGPVATGVLDAATVVATRSLVERALAFFAARARGQRFGALPLELYEHHRHLDYPRGDDGLCAAYVHPERQGRDFALVDEGAPVFLGFDGTEHHFARTDADGDAPLYAVFINEAAYYEKGIAMTLTQKRTGTAASLSSTS